MDTTHDYLNDEAMEDDRALQVMGRRPEVPPSWSQLLAMDLKHWE